MVAVPTITWLTLSQSLSKLLAPYVNKEELLLPNCQTLECAQTDWWNSLTEETTKHTPPLSSDKTVQSSHHHYTTLGYANLTSHMHVHSIHVADLHMQPPMALIAIIIT